MKCYNIVIIELNDDLENKEYCPYISQYETNDGESGVLDGYPDFFW